MKFYIISNDSVLLKYWMASLSRFSPLVVSSLFDLAVQEESVIFISDTVELDGYDHFTENKIMVLSRFPDFEQAQKYLQIGALGYGNAMMHKTHLLSAYKVISAGEMWLYPDFISKLILRINEDNDRREIVSSKLYRLTPREKEVAFLLSSGESHIEVSEKLSISIRTIKAHSTAIFSKLGVKDRLGLAVYLHQQ